MQNQETQQTFVELRKPVKRFKSDKCYDRTRDRKDKRLYEVDYCENYGENEVEQNTQSIF